MVDQDKLSSAGAARLRCAERRQLELRAMSLDELISDDHPARLIWELTGRFDYAALLANVAAREGTPGHPQTDPHILVAVWLYATLEGVGSARALARLCEQHHAYRWLCGGVGMNHHTLADFRVDHEAWLDAQLARGIASLLQAGVITLDSVAQDGLRVRAAAGASSFRRAGRLDQFLQVAKARVRQLREEIEDNPAAQDKRRQAAATRAAADRLARIEAALAALPDAQDRKARNHGSPDEARVSTTDPDARIMKMPDGGFRPAFNVQYVAETRHRLVIGVDVTRSGADQDALEPMQQRMAAAHQPMPRHWLADGGYVTQDGIERSAARGCQLIMPIPARVPPRHETPAAAAWRARMMTAAGKQLYALRGRTIEWVNAGARSRGLYAVKVRGLRKVRAVALWHALANNISCIIHSPQLRQVALPTTP